MIQSLIDIPKGAYCPAITFRDGKTGAAKEVRLDVEQAQSGGGTLRGEHL